MVVKSVTINAQQFIMLLTALLLLGVLLGSMWTTAVNQGVPACKSEDSTNCYWDAERSGNGLGTSFVDIDGTTFVPLTTD